MNLRLQKPPFYWLLSLLLLSGLLTACATPTNAEPQPPEIIYGQELCEACGMLIDDARFAAATLTTDGTTHKFESIADMVAWHMEHPEAQVRAWFVHDYGTEAWLRAETAHFVVSPQLHATMPPGVAAFEHTADAQALADQFAVTVLTFDEMRLAVHVAAHGFADRYQSK